MSRWHLVTEDFPPGFCGGIASWTMDLALALHAQSETVQVYARHTGKTSAHDQGLPWHTTRMRGRSWARWKSRWAQWALRGAIQPGDRVVFTHWGLAVHGSAAIKRAGASLGLSFHGSDLTQLHAAPAELKQTIQQADALLPVSSFLASELLRLGLTTEDDSRVHRLPMPVPSMPQRSGAGSGLVCVARPTQLKRLDRAQNLADALGLSLRCIGADGIVPRDQVHRAVAQAVAVVLLPSSSAEGMGAEGLGLVLLEAAAQGVPTIGCRTGGVPEAIGPGLLIDPDSPDLDAVRTFLADPSSGPRARSWVRANHSPGAAVSTLKTALKTVLR